MCEPGYFGPFCRIPCPSGSFGPKCGGSCFPKCSDDACDHVHGCLENPGISTRTTISGYTGALLNIKLSIDFTSTLIQGYHFIAVER